MGYRCESSKTVIRCDASRSFHYLQKWNKWVWNGKELGFRSENLLFSSSQIKLKFFLRFLNTNGIAFQYATCLPYTHSLKQSRCDDRPSHIFFLIGRAINFKFNFELMLLQPLYTYKTNWCSLNSLLFF